MKIICDKDEFALLVRECQLCEAQNKCGDCLFGGLCSVAGNEEEMYMMDGIEDICEISVEG